MTTPAWSGTVRTRSIAYWKRRIAAGGVCCLRCGGEIEPSDRWEPDHVTPLVQGGALGIENQHPSHRRCNRRHGQALATRTIKARSMSKGVRPW